MKQLGEDQLMASYDEKCFAFPFLRYRIALEQAVIRLNSGDVLGLDMAVAD